MKTTNIDIVTLRELLCNDIPIRKMNKEKKKEKFIRILPSDYADGEKELAGENRPSTREISNQIFAQESSIPNKKNATNFFWLWGQFIDHEFTLVNKGNEKANIKVPTGDIHFDPNSTGNIKLPFTRSEFDSETGKNGIPREQLNSLTPEIDASSVYGSSILYHKYMREYKYGLMKCSEGGLLPINDGNIEMADEGFTHGGLFIAGDVRANEHVGLIAIHNLFVREHNYWAKKIYKANSKLCDEEIFQKAKIMVESEIQAITVNEFLPLLLGSFPEYCGYNENIKPQISNCFAACAFRLGHTLVPTEIIRGKKLRELFFAPHIICNDGGIDCILKEFTQLICENLDDKVVDDLRNFLFGKPGNGGLDLIAINIQRGRDHGLPDYNTARKTLGLKCYNSFDDFDTDIETKQKLENLYKTIDNVDLFVGGLVDNRDKCKNGQLGDLFAKIVRDQFLKIRDGDIYWYENRLTRKLIKIINHTKLSDIIKRNTCVKNIQDYVMIGKKCYY